MDLDIRRKRVIRPLLSLTERNAICVYKLRNPSIVRHSRFRRCTNDKEIAPYIRTAMVVYKAIFDITTQLGFRV